MPPAAAAAPAGGGAAAGQQREQQGGVGQIVGTILRFGLMWYMFSSWNRGQQGAKQPPGSASAPLFRRGDMLDMYVYISESPLLHVADRAGAELVWKEHDIALATSPERTLAYSYSPSEAVTKHNGSVYAHTVFVRAGLDLDTPSEDMPPDSLFVKSVNLVSYLPERVNKSGVNLLSDGANFTASKTADPAKPWVSFLKPNLTIALVDHFTAYPKASIPPQVSPHLLFNADGQQFPLVYFDEFWLLRDKLLPLNDSLGGGGVTLHLAVKPMKFWWMQLQTQMEQSFQLQINMGIAQHGEADEVKRIFLEGNPVLLGVTMAVSLLHSVFDFLAFKNDIGFWRENKSMEGLSARSIVINAFCQLVIFLYLLDNETSMVVLFSAGVGTLIEFWKVTKAMDVSVDHTWPYLHVKDRASYSSSATKAHDATAMRYLSYVLYPAVAGYAAYTLAYETHTSWYSWLLGSLVGAVYTFGFILMCPQLYLNYKLQSVAHLPWRQMTYKFLNTIIDDLFAFVIKMPTLHRLSVFRDDIIFLIYLYQRWIYRVDMTRVNEFGFSGQQAAERDAAAAAPALEGAHEEAEDAGAAADGKREDGSTRRRRPVAAAAANGSSTAAAAEAPATANGSVDGGGKKSQ